MFSKLLFVRLKAAENALRDGRLDEAYRLATAPDIREHRRGGAVLAQLTEKFIERARQHYRAERFTEALMDLDRAEAGGVMQEQIVELRGQIRTVAAEVARREQTRRDRLDAARRRIEDGSLLAGQRILERASGVNHEVVRLQQAADERAHEARSIVEQAEALISQGQLAAAAGRVKRAKLIDAHGSDATRVEARLCELVLQRARQAVADGRLGRAADELSCLGDLGEALPAKREVRDILSTAKETRSCIQSHRFADARRHAMSLSRVCPDATWVHQVIEQLKTLDDALALLASSPLGDRMDRTAIGARQAVPAADRGLLAFADLPPPLQSPSPDDTVALPAIRGVEGHGPDRLLMLVDGGGSYLLILNGKAAIGRAGASHPAEIPLHSDVSERHANLTRMEDDFFVFAAKDIEVGGQRTRHHLLRDGDRVVLGKKAKFTFRLPSRKSPTAVLDLSDTTKMPHDVRRVVLFHRQATMGRSLNDHIRCQHLGTTLVLFERDGALWIRRKNDGHVDTQPVRVTLGAPMEVDGASFVVSPWPADKASRT